ncbi:MAG: group II intron reverse transcriptase/maturase, partial [Gemmatimonadales bacterium]
MSDTPPEDPPPPVPEGATQGGEIRARWAWVEPTVWSERMLEALEQGVKGGVWFSLIDKVYASRTLAAAWRQVHARDGAGGVDRQTVAQFATQADTHLQHLSAALRTGTYVPQPVRRCWIEKPGSVEKRPLGIPTVKDRVVQTALRLVLEPIFEREFLPCSYGFRPQRGCKDALRAVQRLLAGGATWVVDADIKSYFDTIPQAPLMTEVRTRIVDGRVLKLLEAYLTQGVLDGLEQWTPEAGTPQGAVISPLLANVYLHPVDQALGAAGYQVVRYADDLVILCASEDEAQRALNLLRTLLETRGLRLHPEKTRVVDATQPGGFEFLGYHCEQGKRWPRKKSLHKLKDTVRRPTRRTRGVSLAVIVGELNPVLRGWFGYFKQSHRVTFRELDEWVRMRLRSLLRKRRGQRGRGRGADHQRWPNAYFHALGLYSLVEARHRVL